MTGTEVAVTRARRTTSVVELVRSDRVVQAALAMVAVQLVFRGWVRYGSWFRYDDLGFVSRMTNDGPGLGTAVAQYGGHVMPVGMWLTWLANAVAPWQYWPIATLLVLGQLLADVGCLALLLRLFGSRPGILPPLALYLFSAISIPSVLWWASGANQLPLQAAFFWGLHAHVAYLRTGRARHALATAAWLVAGLACFEKTLLVLGAIAILSLAYFADGSLPQRLRTLWRHYRLGISLYTALGVAYLVLYVLIGLTFDPRRAGNPGLDYLVSNMVVQAWLPGIVGGPLHWTFLGPNNLPRPGAAGVLVALAVAVVVVRELAHTRRRSLRAWWLVVFFLACNLELVLAGRASFVGPAISLDYRYQAELPAVTAIALACAALPILGAVEPVEIVRSSRLLDVPVRVVALTAVVSLLGTVSAGQLAWHWHRTNDARPYFDNLFTDLQRTGRPVPLVDASAPTTLMLAASFPGNELSHLLHDDPHGAVFVRVATDHLSMVDQRGRVVPAVVPAVRRARPGPRPPCGYRVGSAPVQVPLNGAVAYGGWWVRIGYLASAAGPVRVTVGDASYSTMVSPGVHALYLRGGGRFDSIRIEGLSDNVAVCTNDVTVGRPVPRTEFHP